MFAKSNSLFHIASLLCCQMFQDIYWQKIKIICSCGIRSMLAFFYAMMYQLFFRSIFLQVKILIGCMVLVIQVKQIIILSFIVLINNDCALEWLNGMEMVTLTPDRKVRCLNLTFDKGDPYIDKEELFFLVFQKKKWSGTWLILFFWHQVFTFYIYVLSEDRPI